MSASLTAVAKRDQPLARLRADRNGMRIIAQQVVDHARLADAVDLVEHQNRIFFADAELFEHAIHGRNLLQRRGVARVGDVQQEVGLPGFFERRLEAGDQAVRQVADETDCVGKQHGPPIGQLPAASARVERGEELVRGELVETR